VACLVLTGLLRTTLQPVELHRWSGHGLVIFLWLGVPFASGVMWERYFRWPALSAILQFVALLAVLAIGLLAAVTGYLGPTFHPISEEAGIRFAVLHKLFLPGILSALLLQWWWYFRPKD
jgi:hypothetical protein